ncbi:hypothetical protein B9G55_09705 [Saccharibacillus sp. O16]|nr:hypothetical protein B9G55_09705 [Saccharibacillus sp. O16]
MVRKGGVYRLTDRSAERKQTIFSVALSLFSERGIKATSMQDIAERCGFSKGTLYQHFRSKEELIQSIHQYALATLQQKLESLESQNHTARETFLAQIEVLLHSLIEFKTFMVMQIREQEFTGIGDGLRQQQEAGVCGPSRHPLLTAAFIQIRRSLIGIYGAEVDRYSGDLFILIGGLTFSYLQLSDDWGMPEIPIPQALQHLERMVDAAVDRLLQASPQPLIAPSLWSGWIEENPILDESGAANRPFILIRQMRDTLAWSPLLRAEREAALETLEVLEAELKEERPRRAIVKGMLGNLREIHSLHGAVEQLEPLLLYRLDEQTAF